MSESFMSRHGDYRGGKKSPLYRRWCGMIERCYYPKTKAFANYGGRGIVVCPEWKKYITFKEWALSNGYRRDLTIERVDNDKGYSPENCIFVTKAVQNLNKRDVINITWQGQTKPLSIWAREIGIERPTLWNRIRVAKWPLEKAMTLKTRTITI